MGMNGSFSGVMGKITTAKTSGAAFLSMMVEDQKYGNVKFVKFMFKDGRSAIKGDFPFGTPVKIEVVDADKGKTKEGDYDTEFYFTGSAVVSEMREKHLKAA